MQYEESSNHLQETQDEGGSVGPALIGLKNEIEANDESIEIDYAYVGRVLSEYLKKPIEGLGFQLKPVYFNEPNKENPIDPTQYAIHNNLGEYLMRVSAARDSHMITYTAWGAVKYNIEEQDFPTGVSYCTAKRGSIEEELIREAARKVTQATVENAKAINEAIQREKREKKD